MKELEELLKNRWILKSQDKELYYRIRDAVGQMRPFVLDKLGCQLIENSVLVKLEKIPAIPENYMGIMEFTSQQEYGFLCILLMFLEDKDTEEQFILSQLTDYIVGNMPETTVDWTNFTQRRQLIKVLRYASNQGIIRVTDGSENAFMDENEGEVLYENTGASRYFMKNFTKDIMGYQAAKDFEESDWFEVNEDRGIARRHRVYKRLLFSTGMYKDGGSEEDFEYLKYYGRRLAEELENTFDCQVHLHKGSAYFLMGDSCRMGNGFPANNTASDILLLCFSAIRKKVEEGKWSLCANETIKVEQLAFKTMIKEVKMNYQEGFYKSFREMPEGEFVRFVVEELERWTFIRVDASLQEVIIYPLAGKVIGQFPKDFNRKAEDKSE